MSGTIKYRYALDSKTEQLTDIEELEKKHPRRDFTCLGCGNIVIPIMGEKHQKHFRHKVDKESSCSGETYWHRLTKRVFHKLYEEAKSKGLEFMIEYSADKFCTRYETDNLTSCPLGLSLVKFDLIKYYPEIDIEKRVDNFVPDLLLTSKNGKHKLFIEIAFTHKSTIEKKESGYRIIEINIDHEVNIELFSNRVISENNKIEFHNFKKVFKENFCGGNCFELPPTYPNNEIDYTKIEPKEEDLQNPVIKIFNPSVFVSCPSLDDFFIIYKDYTSKLINLTKNELMQQEQNISHAEYIIFNHNFPRGLRQARDKVHKEKVIESFRKGHKISSCFLCKYHKENYSSNIETQIHCDLLHNFYNSNNAVNCLSYNVELLEIELAKTNSIKNDFKKNDLVRYIGGMIKYKDKVGKIVNASNNRYRCDFGGKSTEWLTREEIQLVK